MASVFAKLDDFFRNFIGSKIQLKSMTTAQILELCKYQKSYLKDFQELFKNFPPEALNGLRQKYLAEKKRNERWPIQGIIKDLQSDTKGKAQQMERTVAFGAAKKAVNTYIKIIEEIEKNYKTLFADNYIILNSARVTDVLFLGIIKEMDIFTKYLGYLWEYFTIVLDHGNTPPGYRQEFLATHYADFVKILNDICNKQDNYRFLDDVDRIKRKNADLVLNISGGSFLPFLDSRNYSVSDEVHLNFGIFGFNFIASILEVWDLWKHTQYLKTKKHREWLQHEQARLLQIYQDIDKDSPEAKMTQQYLDAYSDAISKLDSDIRKYENPDEYKR